MPRKFRITAPKGLAKKLRYGKSHTLNLTTAAVTAYNSTANLVTTSTGTDTNDLPMGVSIGTQTDDLKSKETYSSTDDLLITTNVTKETQTDSLPVEPTITYTEASTQTEVLINKNCLSTTAIMNIETTVNEPVDNFTLISDNDVEDASNLDNGKY